MNIAKITLATALLLASLIVALTPASVGATDQATLSHNPTVVTDSAAYTDTPQLALPASGGLSLAIIIASGVVTIGLTYAAQTLLWYKDTPKQPTRY